MGGCRRIAELDLDGKTGHPKPESSWARHHCVFDIVWLFDQLENLVSAE